MQNSGSPNSVHSSPLNPNSFSIMSGSEASTRRQRIAMACQYCRHRKIKCCGSDPCANCTRARRSCDYSPVPEEVNRATREKKAAAKAAKQYAQARAAPYFVDQSVYSMPYLAGPGPIRGTHVPPRRSFSTPVTFSPYSPNPHYGQHMTSPAHFDSPWFSTPPVPVISVSPMVPVMPVAPDHTPLMDAGEDPNVYATYSHAPVSPTESSASTSYPMPVTPVRKPILNTPPHTPSQAYFQPTPNLLTYTPQPFPFSPSPLAQSTFSTSPTLCPGLPVPPQKALAPQPLVGLGIGLTGNEENTYAPNVSNEYLSATNAWTQPDHNYF